ncbi:MAG: NAD-dependent deacetylase [Phycisphaerales bacterium JB039]
MEDVIRQAAQWLAEARRVVAFTGAGVSAESGLDTFRDPEQGLWSEYDPMELAHIDAFHRDPELVTRWYHWRFCRCVDCQPNPGHHALARIERELAQRGALFTLATQNIDGLHQRAGSRNVLELHGTILTWRGVTTGEMRPIDRVSFDRFPPRTEGGDLLRPNIVWFGEALPEAVLRQAMIAAATCDLLLAIGTSAVVYPAAGLIDLAADGEARVVEINREPTGATAQVDLAIHMPSGEALPQLAEAAFGPAAGQG